MSQKCTCPFGMTGDDPGCPEHGLFGTDEQFAEKIRDRIGRAKPGAERTVAIPAEATTEESREQDEREFEEWALNTETVRLVKLFLTPHENMRLGWMAARGHK